MVRDFPEMSVKVLSYCAAASGSGVEPYRSAPVSG
jgi:hypothetical protein